MSQSLVNNLVHLVYSTKHREPLIPEDELRALFDRHQIDYDERYVWD